MVAAGEVTVRRRARAQLIYLFDRGRIQHSTARHADVVFARKLGPWSSCYDYRGLDAIARPAVEPLPHTLRHAGDLLLQKDLASSYHSYGYGPVED